MRHFGGSWGAEVDKIGGGLALLAGAELALVGGCGGGNQWR